MIQYYRAPFRTCKGSPRLKQMAIHGLRIDHSRVSPTTQCGGLEDDSTSIPLFVRSVEDALPNARVLTTPVVEYWLWTRQGDAVMSALMTHPTATKTLNTSDGQPAVGLHGHPLEANMARASVAESIGSFVLVLTIVSTVVAANLARSVAGTPYGSLAVPAAGGLALAVIVASLGHISGAHVNPAVTLGLAVNRRFPWAYVPAYLLSQLGGAIGAALVAWSLYGDRARSVVHLGATYPAAGEPIWRIVSVEGVVTFLLVLVVVSVATDSRVPAGAAALAIGSALAAAILISGPISGAGVNPARALGPMIVASKFTDWWAYIIAPLIGGTLAITAYDRILRGGSTPI